MNETPTRGRYWLAVRERWLVVVLALVLSVASAVAYSLLAEKRYEASADVLVSPVSSDTLVGLPVLRENLFGRSVITAGRLAKNPQVAARVRNTLNLDLPLAAVSALITVRPQEQSDILTITSTGDSPEEAARIANTFARALLAERTEQFQLQLRAAIARLSSRLDAVGDRPGSAAQVAALSSRLADYRALVGGRDPTLDIVSSAIPPSAPTSPRPRLNVVVASVIGLLLGLGIVVGLEVANPVVRRVESVAQADGPPILARMPRPGDNEARAALSFPYSVAPGMRAPVRSLWANLGSLVPPGHERHAGQRGGPEARTLLITSGGLDSSDGEGAPALAALLAAVMARGGESVVLLDADLERRPIQAIADGDDASLVDVDQPPDTREAAVASNVSQDADMPNDARNRLQVMVADVNGRQPTAWDAPERLSKFVVDLKRDRKTLLIVAPPLPAAETSVLSGVVDAVIIVIAIGRTRLDRVSQLRDGFAERGVAKIGLVVLEQPSLSKRIAKASSNVKTAARWT